LKVLITSGTNNAVGGDLKVPEFKQLSGNAQKSLG